MNEPNVEKPRYEVIINYVIGWSDPGHGFNSPDLQGGFVIGWLAKNVGFGQLTFRMKDGQIHMETEAMNDEFVRAVLDALLSKAVREE